MTSKCLTCKHEDCGLIHRPHARELGLGLRTCNPSTREADTGGLAQLLGLGMMRLKNQRMATEEQCPMVLWPHGCTYMNTKHTYMKCNVIHNYICKFSSSHVKNQVISIFFFFLSLQHDSCSVNISLSIQTKTTAVQPARDNEAGLGISHWSKAQSATGHSTALHSTGHSTPQGTPLQVEEGGRGTGLGKASLLPGPSLWAGKLY